MSITRHIYLLISKRNSRKSFRTQIKCIAIVLCRTVKRKFHTYRFQLTFTTYNIIVCPSYGLSDIEIFIFKMCIRILVFRILSVSFDLYAIRVERRSTSVFFFFYVHERRKRLRTHKRFTRKFRKEIGKIFGILYFP